MRHAFLYISFSFICLAAMAQQPAAPSDSARLLDAVVVRAFDGNRSLLEVPGSVALISMTDLQRFGNTSLLPVVNTIPGVRMEERSPGSYRFSIRGSSLRAPFGVRNVKVYWNELPLTDAGGNTYLNQLDFNQVGQAEIIKGPGSSLYGAGTGGVILLGSTLPGTRHRTAEVGWIGGSYGLLGVQGAFKTNGNNQTSLQFAHQRADGYREHSAMVRDIISYNSNLRLDNRQTLAITTFYSDLHYETPGGLTLQEYQVNPRSARPSTNTLPGAVAQHAAVSQRSFYSGVSHHIQLSSHWSARNGVYGNFVQFENPSIRNVEHRLEQTAGMRSNVQYNFESSGIRGQINFGGELQAEFSPIKTYGNNGGTTGTLQADSEIRTVQYFLFSQARFDLPHHWQVTVGASYNRLEYAFQELTVVNPSIQRSAYAPVITPRLAVLRPINEYINAHASLSSGFSPPTIAEIRPSTGVFTPDLKAESGTNYELGIRGSHFHRQLQFDLSAYSFDLKQAIVVRRDLQGADYYVNAGGTQQRGIEYWMAWQSLRPAQAGTWKLWTSATWQHYRFRDYVKGTLDYSGNAVTGVPGNVIAGGADLSWRSSYLRLTASHTDAIPLNDANTVSADAYTLLGARLGYSLNPTWGSAELFVGADNLLDVRYSLGNDLNAAGNRYFNAAAGRTLYAGVRLKIESKE